MYTNTNVSSINKIAHTITTVNWQNGDQKSFEDDKLILAQGGNPVIPELPGAGLSQFAGFTNVKNGGGIALMMMNRNLI